ncbi:MAG: hypothetical protein U0X76_08065 [Bacteroidia bacterium]
MKKKNSEVKAGKDIKRQGATEVTLWNEHEDGHHHWGLSIDLNSCISCGSCVVRSITNIENNVSVVGKDEVRRSREVRGSAYQAITSAATDT